jgi:hypothetical protein
MPPADWLMLEPALANVMFEPTAPALWPDDAPDAERMTLEANALEPWLETDPTIDKLRVVCKTVLALPMLEPVAVRVTPERIDPWPWLEPVPLLTSDTLEPVTARTVDAELEPEPALPSVNTVLTLAWLELVLEPLAESVISRELSR